MILNYTRDCINLAVHCVVRTCLFKCWLLFSVNFNIGMISRSVANAFILRIIPVEMAQ